MPKDELFSQKFFSTPTESELVSSRGEVSVVVPPVFDLDTPSANDNFTYLSSEFVAFFNNTWTRILNWAHAHQVPVGNLSKFLDYYALNKVQNKSNLLLYTMGTEQLAAIVDKLEDEMVSEDLKRNTITNLFNDINVCPTGSLSNIQDALLKLTSNPKIKLMHIKREIGKELILKIVLPLYQELFEYHPGNDIHYVNHLLNYSADELGLALVHEDLQVDWKAAAPSEEEVDSGLSKVKNIFRFTQSLLMDYMQLGIVIENIIDTFNIDDTNETLATATINTIESELNRFGNDSDWDLNNLIDQDTGNCHPDFKNLIALSLVKRLESSDWLTGKVFANSDYLVDETVHYVPNHGLKFAYVNHNLGEGEKQLYSYIYYCLLYNQPLFPVMVSENPDKQEYFDIMRILFSLETDKLHQETDFKSSMIGLIKIWNERLHHALLPNVNEYEYFLRALMSQPEAVFQNDTVLNYLQRDRKHKVISLLSILSKDNLNYEQLPTFMKDDLLSDLKELLKQQVGLEEYTSLIIKVLKKNTTLSNQLLNDPEADQFLINKLFHNDFVHFMKLLPPEKRQQWVMNNQEFLFELLQHEELHMFAFFGDIYSLIPNDEKTEFIRNMDPKIIEKVIGHLTYQEIESLAIQINDKDIIFNVVKTPEIMAALIERNPHDFNNLIALKQPDEALVVLSLLSFRSIYEIFKNLTPAMRTNFINHNLWRTLPGSHQIAISQWLPKDQRYELVDSLTLEKFKSIFNEYNDSYMFLYLIENLDHTAVAKIYDQLKLEGGFENIISVNNLFIYDPNNLSAAGQLLNAIYKNIGPEVFFKFISSFPIADIKSQINAKPMLLRFYLSALSSDDRSTFFKNLNYSKQELEQILFPNNHPSTGLLVQIMGAIDPDQRFDLMELMETKLRNESRDPLFSFIDENDEFISIMDLVPQDKRALIFDKIMVHNLNVKELVTILNLMDDKTLFYQKYPLTQIVSVFNPIRSSDDLFKLLSSLPEQDRISYFLDSVGKLDDISVIDLQVKNYQQFEKLWLAMSENQEVFRGLLSLIKPIEFFKSVSISDFLMMTPKDLRTSVIHYLNTTNNSSPELLSAFVRVYLEEWKQEILSKEWPVNLLNNIKNSLFGGETVHSAGKSNFVPTVVKMILREIEALEKILANHPNDLVAIQERLHEIKSLALNQGLNANRFDFFSKDVAAISSYNLLISDVDNLMNMIDETIKYMPNSYNANVNR